MSNVSSESSVCLVGSAVCQVCEKYVSSGSNVCQMFACVCQSYALGVKCVKCVSKVSTGRQVCVKCVM